MISARANIWVHQSRTPLESTIELGQKIECGASAPCSDRCGWGEVWMDAFDVEER